MDTNGHEGFMKHSLTIVMVTGREEAQIDWAYRSLRAQLKEGDRVERFILVDAATEYPETVNLGRAPDSGMTLVSTPPKPTIWQGAHRVTAEDWWAASNARNTGLCLTQTEWVAFLDDRCVLMPGWLQSIREAMAGGYAVFGAYEKRHGMRVENGVIVEPGTVTGEDGRLRWMREGGRSLDAPMKMFREWGYGCTLALPLEWALAVGGFEQAMDGLGFEDVIFGMMLGNHGWPLMYDPRMMIIEDRTPEHCGKVYRKEDKGVSPQDKSHLSLELFGTAWQTTNRAQLWQSRAAVLKGGPWPVLLDSRTDWWDGEVIGREYMETAGGEQGAGERA